MLHCHQISMLVQSQLKEERDDLINHTNDGVAFIGSALLGKVGPLIGSADIVESEDAYVFRVSLLGVARDEIEETKVVHSLPNEKKKVQPFLLLELLVSKKVFTSVPPSQRVLMPLNRGKSNLLCRRMMELPSSDFDPPATLDLPFQPRF
ncbi:Alpha-crystallin domain-containing protein 22.3 [Capsicum chinense]|nr:Alpha-crystallin domain-containing protein 22.3 [Capsicum chinense]